MCKVSEFLLPVWNFLLSTQRDKIHLMEAHVHVTRTKKKSIESEIVISSIGWQREQYCVRIKADNFEKGFQLY